MPKVLVSSTASNSFSCSSCGVGYGGRSSRLKQVCARGSDSTRPHRSMQKRRGPVDPRSAEKPSYGIEDVPVTNWTSRNLCSLVNLCNKIYTEIKFCFFVSRKYISKNPIKQRFINLVQDAVTKTASILGNAWGSWGQGLPVLLNYR